ncbi:MAG: hypothetical protein AB7N65_12945 [Vicinamibacterales bacterium]
MATAPRIRYRRISTRMWHDEKFLALSAPKPNARDLWVWLLAGPLTTPVPGVVLTTMGGMADRLQWPLSATRRCWDEIAAREMATADWAHSLVWLPRALRHNPPESPNVVKSWRRFLDDNVPECPLRADLEASVQAFLEGFGEAFLKAFGEAFGEGVGGSFPESGNRSTGTGSTPLPPSGEGGRVTRAERQRAERILKSHSGYCPHQPRCESSGHCIGRIVREHRRSVAAGLTGVAS